MPAPRRPDPPPLPTNDVRTVAVMTVLWAVAGIVLAAAFRDRVGALWLWTCLAGVVLGLAGIRFCVRRRARLARTGRAD